MKNIVVSSILLWSAMVTNNRVPVRDTAELIGNRVNPSHFQAPGNQIVNGYALQSIKKKMHKRDSSLVLIKVLHIGDSHIKAGFFSQALMEKLNAFYAQKFRGNLFFNFQLFCKIGTKYADYNELAELDNQLKRERPDLVIISLGTNDAFSGSSRSRFYEKIDHLVKKINNLSPEAALLFTTPSDALRKNPLTGIYTTVPELQFVTDEIIRYANDHQLAYWNLHQIMGGDASINNWYLKKMAEPDRVHFTARGYKLFADWLFSAFTSCLENYNPKPFPFHF